jgi:hypothetical protein
MPRPSWHGCALGKLQTSVSDFVLLTDLGLTANIFPMGRDSHSAQTNIENPMSCGRTKHLEFRCHFVREVAMQDEDPQEEYSKCKSFKFWWVASKAPIADTFTKIVPGNVHDSLSEGIGLKD